ncbi:MULTISPECIES: hypothetical protein [Nocardioides]|uniref:Secreted protein n=1 Tax=Nocardioides vastitatis TaxID=2568655 RepID=A0ABW0ZEK6_9ACTN|nr:hypothetical protein [Nocardioides sp.]THJ14474.1 hypothetical protein E7Z54_01350 [Nocardioides sp.]
MRVRHLVALIASTLALSVGFAAPAGAHTGAPPGDAVCTGDDNWVRSCFVQDTDNFWVRDTETDGRSAVVFWSTRTGQSGSCRNAHGAGTWHMCAYDFPEFTSGGSPNRVYWDHYTYDAQTNDYNLVSSGYSTCTAKGCPAII